MRSLAGVRTRPTPPRRGAAAQSGRLSGRLSGRASARVVVLAAAVAVTVAACGDDSSSSGASSGGSSDPKSVTVTVSAASSLTGTFDELKKQFEAAHKGVTLRINYGGSDALAQQIVTGAPVDVFASANQTTMAQVRKAGLVTGDAKVFTRNVLEIAVPNDNPGKVTGIADFAKDDLRIAVCAPSVPCGAAANKVFAAANVKAKPDTLEDDVKSVLTKVQLGEVDAGLVYRTDVQSAAGKVKGVDFPEATGAVNDYYLAAVSDKKEAAEFVAFVEGDAGQKVLQAAGFQAP